MRNPLSLKGIPELYVKSFNGDYDESKQEYVSTLVKAPIYEKDGKIYCNGEGDNYFLFFDYNGEERGNLPWISEELEKWCKDNFGENAYWEWELNVLLSISN